MRLRVQSDADLLDLTFSQATWRQIREQSLTLTGLPYASVMVMPEVPWLTTLEGQLIKLRDTEGYEDVTLIRASDLLVQDAQGTYFHAAINHLRFPTAPPQSG
ncbi:hypothetical protein C8263_15390 [Deinococcus arcticus]|uniref:Uncharacterized protein n=1 Tax=Deinococcus arcticus TaxID=2136176 RepID=A0A2T3W4Z9_9DEIO|nr:hypothetical protein C8263_15390 [Deinococcus arcticus]